MAADPCSRLADITAEIMAEYWRRVDRLIAGAQRAGMDLAVSSPRVEDGNLIWEHRLVEPGGTVTDGRPDLRWIIYRCS